MSSLKHPVAYNTVTKEVVSPLGTAFNNAREYDAAVDKGNLTCIHCFRAAMVHYREGGEEVPGMKRRMIAGDNLPGNQAHLQTAPRRQHADDCVASVITQDESYDPDKINHEKGFKIYVGLGTIKRQFKNNASVVRYEDKRLVVMDPDLLDRETISAKTPKDLVKLIKAGYLKRLNDSVIVHHDDRISWNDFFIRKGTEPNGAAFKRWAHLAQSLIAGKDQPALIHVDLHGRQTQVFSNNHGERMRITLDKFRTYHPETGEEITVVPMLQVRNELMFSELAKSEPVGDLFAKGALTNEAQDKEILVLATPHIYKGKGRLAPWFMDIELRNPKRLMDVNLREISLEAKLRADVRAAATVADPERSPA